MDIKREINEAIDEYAEHLAFAVAGIAKRSGISTCAAAQCLSMAFDEFKTNDVCQKSLALGAYSPVESSKILATLDSARIDQLAAQRAKMLTPEPTAEEVSPMLKFRAVSEAILANEKNLAE